MRDWTERFRDGGGQGTDRISGYGVELSFRVADGHEVAQRRRRVALVCEALKEIERRDPRLRDWYVLRPVDPEWIHLRAVVEANQPGEVAQLSEMWMQSAIAAANLATTYDSAVLPAPREAGWALRALPSVTAQVLADV